jgi:peptidoglycan/LPS O-acetylase OafA/YrhL
LNPTKLGLLLILAGLCFEYLPAAVYSNLDFWRTSPNLFFIRTGCACLLLAMPTRATEQLRFPQEVLHALSRESLIIYIVHICILYGSPSNTGLRHRIGPSLGLTATLGCIAALVVSMVAVALTWHRLKGANLFGRVVSLPATALAMRVPPSRGRQK